MKKWCECKIEVKKGNQKILENFLSNYQFCSYSVYQKSFSRKAEIRAFIPFSKRKKFLQELYSAIELIPIISKDPSTPTIHVSFKKNDEYTDEWKRYFKPLKIGRFVIKPTWEEWKAKKGELVLEMDPGMAFGTGQHFTTCYCIKLLQKYSLKGLDFIDVGCGSGILSIVAEKLKAKTITGLDISRSAVNTSKENFKKNCTSKNAEFKCMRLERMSLEKDFDLVVANLTDTVIVNNAFILKSLVRNNGILILTGIRFKKMSTVISLFKDLQILDSSNDSILEWGGCAFRKTAK